jgi:hypothetical protein
VFAYVAVLVGVTLIALGTGIALAGTLRAVAADAKTGARPVPAHRRPTAAQGRHTSTRRRIPAQRRSDLDDYGLLRTVALAEDLDTGRSIRDLLMLGGVRATIATGGDGLTRVLVFPQQYDQARRVVSWVL